MSKNFTQQRDIYEKVYIYIYIYMLYMLYDGKRFGQVKVTYSMYQLLSPGGFFRAKKFHLSDL